MHGIPGFEVDDLPVAVRDSLGETDAIGIVRDRFGIDASGAERLTTERDDSFIIRCADQTGGRFDRDRPTSQTPVPAPAPARAREQYVLKVAHPADTDSEIDFQTRALEFARHADPALPLQRIVPTSVGQPSTRLPDHGNRIARLFEWLPGDLLRTHRPDDAQLRALGGALGQLTHALVGFEHPADERPFAWDLAQFAKLETLVERYPQPELRTTLQRFHERVAPHLAELPRQVVHNDFNPGNVLVDPTSPAFVTGILDFGDAIRTIRIADVAVALSYQLVPFGRDWHDLHPFLEGYEQWVALTPPEHDTLQTLVECRLAQRILINRWLSESDPTAGDESYRALMAETLRRLPEED